MRPDFSRTERAGYSILYPETEEALEWMESNDEPANLSGGMVADDDVLRAIRDAGLSVAGDEE
jgi:hypothetical protein